MEQKQENRKAALQYLAGNLGPLLLRSLGVTLRVRRLGLENIEAAREIAGNILFVVWHARLLPLTYIHRNEGINVLVSTHQDGEYIARVIHGMGFGTSRGSSTRGGIRALRELIQAAGRQADLAVTPDGPRGPRETVRPGAVYLAKRLGLPVIPIGVSSKPCIRLRSWDRFMIPLPFARCTVVYGEPVVYDGPLTEESMKADRDDLERRLRRIAEEAEHVCGW
jgi:lysophospholipid acyltransferase (LPLAT)-like uncharacterized protein